jgi:hypothetical protein
MTKAVSFRLPTAALLAFLFIGSHAAARAQGEPADSALEFAGLEEKADEVVKVNLWGRPLEHAKKLLGLRKNVTASVRSFMNGLTAVYRRTYRFRRARASEDDVEPVHRQLAEDGWVAMIETGNREKPESLSVYSFVENEEVAGMTVVSSDPEEVTVLKIMGPVDFEALSAIGSGLGLPVMNLATTDIKKVNAATGDR